MYGCSILRTFDYPNTLPPQLVQIIEVPLYLNHKERATLSSELLLLLLFTPLALHSIPTCYLNVIKNSQAVKKGATSK